MADPRKDNENQKERLGEMRGEFDSIVADMGAVQAELAQMGTFMQTEIQNLVATLAGATGGGMPGGAMPAPVAAGGETVPAAEVESPIEQPAITSGSNGSAAARAERPKTNNPSESALTGEERRAAEAELKAVRDEVSSLRDALAGMRADLAQTTALAASLPIAMATEAAGVGAPPADALPLPDEDEVVELVRAFKEEHADATRKQILAALRTEYSISEKRLKKIMNAHDL